MNSNFCLFNEEKVVILSTYFIIPFRLIQIIQKFFKKIDNLDWRNFLISR
jgi:hypothetical protein